MLTEFQKKERLLGIGGSDASAMVGISNYMTPLELYLIKVGEIIPEDTDSEAAYWGNKLEPTVAQECAERMGFEIEKPSAALVHPEYYWLRCNLDFVVKGKPIVGECKTTGYFDNEKWGKDGTEDMPDEYLFQCAHNAIVSDAFFKTELVVLPVLAGGKGGHRYRVYNYERNKNLEDQYIDISRKFWQEHVEKRNPPDIKNISDTRLRWPEDSGEIKVATSDAIKIIGSINEIRNSMKPLEDREEYLRMELCKYMEDASILVDNDNKKLATWKTQKRTGLDTDLFKKEFSDLYQQFSKTSQSRVLRISK
jgi:putative phage-type endonuclease